jgi:response regulator RpfG family c-di-GMP phosphodiesterase
MRIFDTCLWIGNHLCLSAQDLKELLHAARVREIGKLGLPDKLLFSQRKHRTPEDQLLYDQYCDHGMAALSEFKQLRGAARLIGQMLENFDGSSRDGRMAHQIPLGSRILRVAAAFEMIMVDHQFKLSTAQVMEILAEKTGSLYDPMLVKLIETYHDLVHGQKSRKSTQLTRITDLAAGMILAQDIWSRNGMKIISKGTRLSEHTLRILRQYPLDSSVESVEVQQ